jgi:GNAT superfamily N-acetyltransferase
VTAWSREAMLAELNEVAFCRFSPETADRCIDEALGRFAAAGVQFRWGVGPDCGPPDLEQRLAARGLVPSQVLAMVREVSQPVEPPALSVVRVDHRTVREFSRVMALGWGSDEATLHRLNERALSVPACAMFLADVDGEAVGVGSSVLTERGALLMGAVVLPAWRGRGVYRALVNARLAHALETGRTLAYSHAMEQTSAPRLARLGFSELYRFTSFHGPAVHE